MSLPQAFADFERFVRHQLDFYFGKQEAEFPADEFPDLQHPLLQGRQLGYSETILLLTALAPHYQPVFFDDIIREFLPKGGDFPAFGGVRGANTRYTLPTGDTALFLLAGSNAEKRQKASVYFDNTHWFAKDQILWLEPVKEGEPKYSGRLILSSDFTDKLLTGHVSPPAFGPDFPAKKITSAQCWHDLVLPPDTLQHLEDLKAWLLHHAEVSQDNSLGRKLKPGYRALFYGPSGAGKTLVATLLGQQFNKDVYRIDLSQVVSKYIGETEKNLEKIFTKAAQRDWILFFDEADALFGKRSQVQNAHDKYANQEVSYLLQRVEDFDGLVILASNFKSNIDQAFLRRFNSIIEFPMPGPGQRSQLWQKALPASFSMDETVNIEGLAARYELTGSAINQVMHYAALQMRYRNQPSISQQLLMEGIQKELKKEDRLLNGQ